MGQLQNINTHVLPEWAQIQTPTIQNIVESHPRRVKAVIAAKEAEVHINAHGFVMGCSVVSDPHTFGHIVSCHNKNDSYCTSFVIYSFPWYLVVFLRARTELPWPRACSGIAESLLMRRWRTSRSGAERNVSTLRGLFPLRSRSLSFSLSRNVGFRPKTCVWPAMMYKTKSWLNEMENQSHRKKERKKGGETEREKDIKGKILLPFSVWLIMNIGPIFKLKLIRKADPIRNEVGYSFQQCGLLWGHCAVRPYVDTAGL